MVKFMRSIGIEKAEFFIIFDVTTGMAGDKIEPEFCEIFHPLFAGIFFFRNDSKFTGNTSPVGEHIFHFSSAR